MEPSQPVNTNLPPQKLEKYSFARMRESVQKLRNGFEKTYREVEDAITSQIQENDDELSALYVKMLNPKL